MRMFAFALLMLLAATPALAREVDGVPMPEQVTARDGEVLVLNGAGVRSKFIFDIYVGALYLPERAGDAGAILDGRGAWRVDMHFVYSEVSASRLADAWREGFADNNPPTAEEAVQDRLGRFVALHPKAVEGDVFSYEYVPDTGTRVSVNGQTRGTIEGADFARALLAVWLGPEPPDTDLKEGMLGGAH